MKLILSLIFLSTVSCCFGSKILAVVPMASRSHAILFERLVAELALKGHEVTYISSYALPEPVDNVKEIIVTEVEKLTEDNKKYGIALFRLLPPFIAMPVLTYISVNVSRAFLANSKFRDFLQSNEKFDFVLGDAFMDESIVAGLSHKYSAPIVGVATGMPNVWANYMVGNPSPSAYVPEPLLSYTSKMTFCQRLYNTALGIYSALIHELLYLPSQERVMREHFGDDLPPLTDIIKNTSLVLVNHHHSLAFARPYLPNMVEIGGYHVPPPKKLPQDLQHYLDESKDGVILFSMGSNVKSADFPNETLQGILKAFSRLKQNVLWKFENDHLEDLPKNIKISKWLPQSDILTHSNLKLFITHGGQLSTTEAAIRGVPVVGIPVMADQPQNMKQMENAGFGLALSYDDLSEESLYRAVTEVLKNSKYQEEAKRRSQLMQDTPLPALDTAVYWIEYVIRHKGALHLRSAAQDLAWYQLYLVDVLAVLLIGAAVFARVNIYLLKLVCKKFFSKKCKKTDKRADEKKKN